MNMEEPVCKAMKEAQGEEPWEGYYLVRSLEMKNLLRFIKTDDLGSVLDMGCGNGFNSCMIAPHSKGVVAADLYSQSPATHSVGLESAGRLLTKLKADNVTLLACSAEKAPFKDETFDTVYAGYALQYLKDRTGALGEVRRILKKGGRAIFVLPNFLERIYAFFQFYLYFFIKAPGVFARMLAGSGGNAPGQHDNMQGRISRLKQDYKYFPFPGPHGAYRNSAIEMIRHIPFCWNREFRNAGFKVARSFTTAFMPYPLVLTASLKMAVILSKITDAFTITFGSMPVVRYLGYNYCVVLKK